MPAGSDALHMHKVNDMNNPGKLLACILVWRNDSHSPTHYYAPFSGQVSVPDFMEFYTDPYTLFEKNLKGIFK